MNAPEAPYKVEPPKAGAETASAEIQALMASLGGLLRNPFLPTPVVDTISRACAVMESIEQRVAVLESRGGRHGAG